MTEYASIENVMNMYLYGRMETPTDLKERLRDDGQTTPTTMNIDTVSYMQGVGRFASLSGSSAVTSFFLGGLDSSLGQRDEAGNIRLTVSDLLKTMDSSAISFSVSHYAAGVGTSDYHYRAFVWGSTSFRLTDSTTFVWGADGSKWIENGAVLPFDDNFDLESSAGVAQAVNPVFQALLDPYHLGRRVDFVFDAASKAAWESSAAGDKYYLTDFLGEYAAAAVYTLTLGLTPAIGAFNVAAAAGQLAAELASSGVIEYNRDGRNIIYDSPRDDVMASGDSETIDDILGSDGEAAIFVAGRGDDQITGSAEGDIVYGMDGVDEVYTVNGDDEIHGDGGNDKIDAGPGNDKLFGGADDDRLTGGYDNDQIDGGAGTDTAVYIGKASDYDIVRNADGSWTISHVRGTKTNGTDQLTSVERAEFTDMSFSLALNSVKSQIDLALVFDTTGSMGSYINQVKSQMASLANAAFQNGNIDARISIAGFKDPGEVTTYLSFTDQVDLAARQSAAIAGISGIGVGGGGDIPEGAYSGALHVLTGGVGEWREEAIARRIVLVTDAPAKDTDLAAEVARYAQNFNSGVQSLRTTQVLGGTLTTATFTATADGSVPSPVQIYTILVGPDWTAETTIRALAENNGGQFFDANSMADLTAAIMRVFTDVAPEIVSDGGGDAAMITLPWGDFSITKVTATDADAADTISYEITGGADAALFDIDVATGELSFLAGPGEVPLDADEDGSYEVIVAASDGLASDSQALSVVFTDRPAFPGIELFGGNGKDRLTGGAGSDILVGENGDDVLYGLGGNDALFGGNGPDSLFGGDGRDLLSGGLGPDLLSGGNGADDFRFGRNGGKDTIIDFDVAEDRIVLAEGLTIAGHDILDDNRDGVLDLSVRFSSGASVTLHGVTDISAVLFEASGLDTMSSVPDAAMINQLRNPIEPHTLLIA